MAPFTPKAYVPPQTRYDSHFATLNDTEAVLERFLVVAYKRVFEFLSELEREILPRLHPYK